MPSQLVLPLSTAPSFGRDDFAIARCNARAVAFIDSWPNWPVAVAAIYGPSGCGKSHLATIWQSASGARSVLAAELGRCSGFAGPLVVENVDASQPTPARDAELFRVLEAATCAAPVLLTGKELPSTWPSVLPDLRSRFSAALSLSLWSPGEELLIALARKLMDDRQLSVPEAVIERIVHSLERSPAAIRAFIAKADAKALAEARPITLGLVRELIAEEDVGLS